MNPKTQLKHLMTLNHIRREHKEEVKSMDLLLGVISCSKNQLLVSDGINSVKASSSISYKRSKGKQRQRHENKHTGEGLEEGSLYIFKDCLLNMSELADDCIEFSLSFKKAELVMPYYFVTKNKNFRELSTDIGTYDFRLLKRKVF